MLNCRDLTRLVSESFDRKLTIRERMSLWMHISMCGICRRFRQLQLRIQDSAGHSIPPADEQAVASANRLSNESRSRLQQLVVFAATGENSNQNGDIL